ncbi:hypothetical protein PTKIN_Ptkin09bG0236400 [Pterospermum kingtungense]
MLRILDLASKDFSGELSGEFFRCLKAMMVMTDEDKANRKYIGDSYYQDSVTIVNKGLVKVFEKILTTFTCVDLSNNRFHGIIPDEIGNLTYLRVLNLSQNSFSSQIPLALVNLKEVESLDLSQNYLSGEIPPQLTTLTFLSVLDLSYNQLEGNIPQSNQFGTFLNDSYKGNPGLCGPPLTKRCNEADVPMAPPEEEADSWVDDISVWKIVLMGYASGLVIGLSIGFTVLNEMGNKWLGRYKRNRRRRRNLKSEPRHGIVIAIVDRLKKEQMHLRSIMRFKIIFGTQSIIMLRMEMKLLKISGGQPYMEYLQETTLNRRMLEVPKNLRSLDDKLTYTLFFMIQGLNLQASWQQILCFEGAIFEGIEVLVHKGTMDSCQKLLTSKGMLCFNLWSFCGVDISLEASPDDIASVFLLLGINLLLTPLPNPKCKH